MPPQFGQYGTHTLITKPPPQRPMSRENAPSIPYHINQSHSYYQISIHFEL